MKYRWEVINRLIEWGKYTSYLEIGVKDGVCFNRVKCDLKAGIDIKPLIVGKGISAMTSDKYFATTGGIYRDIIFIDGDHHEGQVLRDIGNSLEALNFGGAIVVHDCNPELAVHATSERKPEQVLWSGTAYRAWLEYRRTFGNLEMFVVDVDWGCGVIRFGSQKPLSLPADYSWEDFDKNRAEWLNLISVEDFRRKFR